MRAVDFKLVAPERVWPVARLSLLPKDGLQMLVTVRKPFQGTKHSS
jgi:hypothetical protein